jgi:O-antigen ligase
LAVALGFWLYLSARVPHRVPRIAITTLLVSGLVVTYSRGPWLGAVVIYALFTALRPKAFTKAFQATMAALLVVWGMSFTAVGARILNSLPFIGAPAESESAVYRQRLAVRAWQLFQEHPLFGDQLAYQKMEDLRQGEGIIDLVNSYAEVAVFYGIVGLALFITPALFAFFGAARQAKRLQSQDPDFSSLGNTLAACVFGTLVIIATCSFGLAISNLFYVLLGLTVAFVRMARANPGTVRAAEERMVEQS